MVSMIKNIYSNQSTKKNPRGVENAGTPVWEVFNPQLELAFHA